MAQDTGVPIGEQRDGLPTIGPAPTSIALLVGWAPSGPAGAVSRVTSFADYRRDFGLDPRSLLGYAVGDFFDNGGSDAYVLRMAGDAIAPTDPAFLTALRAAFAASGPVDQIDPFNLICVPGLTDAASIAMLQVWASARRAFLIADCDKADTVAGVIASLAGKTGQGASNSALYFPWVMASDRLDNNAVRAFPPCGFVAGIFARLDVARGVWKAPVGTDANLIGASDLAVHVTDAQEQQLNAPGINCLRSLVEGGLVVFGARTLDGDDSRSSDWKYVSVRRLALFVEQSVAAGTRWAMFEPNDETLWARLRSGVSDFMYGLFKQRAFPGSTSSQSYFVKCDGTTTTQADIDRGVVNIVIGLAALRPAEFIVLTIAQPAATRVTN